MPNQHVLLRDCCLSDAFEQQLAQDWLPLEVSQLTAGTFDGQLREIKHDDVSVFFEHQNCMVHKRGIMDSSFCTISFARSTNAQVRLAEYDSQDNLLFFIPSGSEIDVQVASDVETVYFRFNQSDFLQRARVVSPQVWENVPTDTLVFESSLRQQLDQFVNDLYSHPLFKTGAESMADDKQIACSSIIDRLLLVLDTSSVSNSPQQDILARRRAKSRVSNAMEFIDASLACGICPSIVDICIKLNMSQRNLQYSFKKILGFTPNAYLYYLRLNRVRAQLSKPDSNDITVTQVAMHWQFWHLGRFAHDYWRLFGEFPSATLLRTQKLKRF